MVQGLSVGSALKFVACYHKDKHLKRLSYLYFLMFHVKKNNTTEFQIPKKMLFIYSLCLQIYRNIVKLKFEG